MIISHIVAVSKNGVIGKANDIPWYIPGELDRFKALTMNKTVIMGRKTYESLPKKLEGRQIIVLSSRLSSNEDYIVAKDITEALNLTQNHEEVFIAGGGQIYESSASLVDRIYYTQVHAHVEGDVTYPVHLLKEFDLLQEEHLESVINYTYQTYQRKNTRPIK